MEHFSPFNFGSSITISKAETNFEEKLSDPSYTIEELLTCDSLFAELRSGNQTLLKL
jgi:hypothetical protein